MPLLNRALGTSLPSLDFRRWGCLLFWAAASPAYPAAPSADRVAARVGDEVIAVSDVERHLRPAPPRLGAKAPEDPRHAALDRAIRVRLFAREARRRGIKAPEGPPLLVEAHLVQGLIRQEMESHGIRADAITEPEARRYFEGHRDLLSRVQSIRLSAIVLGADAAERAEPLLRAAEKATEGEFRNVVTRHSVDEASRSRGGHLAVVDGDGHGVDDGLAALALLMRRAGQVGLAHGSDGRVYVLRGTEVRLDPRPWDEAMAVRVKNLMVHEERERVLSDLAQRLLATTRVTVEARALDHLRIPTALE